MMAPRLLKVVFSVIGLLGFSAGCFSQGPMSERDEESPKAGDAARCIVPDEGGRMADQVLQLVNLERSKAGLPPVVVNPVLEKVAADYACRMIEDDFFAHRDPITGHGPAGRAVAAKYSYYSIGENLAAGQETPAEVMDVWMDSSSHHDIILDPRWKDVGIAVRSGGEFSIYWVQEFGDPAGF